jgi:hypothetical protein
VIMGATCFRRIGTLVRVISSPSMAKRLSNCGAEGEGGGGKKIWISEGKT